MKIMIKSPGFSSKEASNDNKKSTTKYLLYFFTFVLFCIVIAVGIRFVVLIRNSTFNASSFSVLINTQNPFALVLNKESKTLAIIYLKPQKNSFKTELYYSIPIDGVTKDKGSITPDDFLSVKTLIFSFLRPGMFSYEKMNSIDVFKFINASLGVPQEQRKTYSLQISKTDEISGMSSSEMFDVLKDTAMVNEAISIEVVNATSVDGLGGRVAQLINNSGGNVVSVTSDDNTSGSLISSQNTSQTVARLSHLLQIPIILKPAASTADIVVILGEDFARKVR